MVVRYGTIRDGRVSRALRQILPFGRQSWVAIIRGIDSARSYDTLVKAMNHHHLPFTTNAGNVVISMETLRKALHAGAFTGFDEVWVFPDGLPNFDLSVVPSATSDAMDLSSSIPAGLSDAIQRSGSVVVVLGDGCGLNYAAPEGPILEAIVRSES